MSYWHDEHGTPTTRGRITVVCIMAAYLVVAMWTGRGNAQGGQTFRIGVSASTDNVTTVLVRWRVTCSLGSVVVEHHGEVWGPSPIRRRLRQSLPGADHCEVRAVAWNVGHPHGQTPVVDTWVTAI